MGGQAVFGTLLTAAGVSFVLFHWWQATAADRRITVALLAVLWIIEAIFIVYVLAAAPVCPFVSR